MSSKKPFNDGMDYLQKLGLTSQNKVNFKSLPKGIRWIGYFIKITIIILVIYSLLIAFGSS